LVWKLGYGLDDQGSVPSRGNYGRFFSSLAHQDWLKAYPVS